MKQFSNKSFETHILQLHSIKNEERNQLETQIKEMLETSQLESLTGLIKEYINRFSEFSSSISKNLETKLLNLREIVTKAIKTFKKTPDEDSLEQLENDLKTLKQHLGSFKEFISEGYINLANDTLSDESVYLFLDKRYINLQKSFEDGFIHEKSLINLLKQRIELNILLDLIEYSVSPENLNKLFERRKDIKE